MNSIKVTAKKYLIIHFVFFEFASFLVLVLVLVSRFYHAMHYSAKRGLAIACRLSVCPSVSVTLVDPDHIG